MKIKLLIFFIFLPILSVSAKIPLAEATNSSDNPPLTHFTLIINQVRGGECCSPGNLEAFTQQLNALKQLQLPAVFALRYDALVDQSVKHPFYEDNSLSV